MIYPADNLLKAEELFFLGRYPESLQALDAFNTDPLLAHVIVYRASSHLLRARNLLHMDMDIEALKCINAIPAAVFDSNPILYAEMCTLTGILKRRECRILWKAGETENALAKANEAIVEFNLAEVAARNGGQLANRLLYNSRLNKLYTNGLILAIEGASKEKFAPLVAESVMAEFNSRQSMTNETRDHVTGTTIVADLALGGGLSIDQISCLSGDVAFSRAYAGLFRHEWQQTWPELILGECRGIGFSRGGGQSRVINLVPSPGAREDSKAKALILGCKLLLTEQKPAADILIAYAYEMHYCAGLLKRNNTSHGTVEKLLQMVREFPKHIYGDPRFPRGTKIFR